MKIVSTLGASLFAALLVVACSSTTTSTSPGVSNMQAGQCLQRGDRCTIDSDCCTGWCANRRCALRNP
jgi:hypothetical protein